MAQQPLRLLNNQEVERLRFRGPFTFDNLVRIGVPRDGSCFFHAVLRACFLGYRTGRIGGRYVSPTTIVRQFRHELAKLLGSRVSPLDASSPTHYDTLSRGQMRELARNMPELSLESMTRELDSSSAVNHIYLEFISNALDKDIYVIDAHTQDVVVYDEALLIKGRNSIVLLFVDGHYELVGLNDPRTPTVGPITYFTAENPFIRYLQRRINEIRHRTNS